MNFIILPFVQPRTHLSLRTEFSGKVGLTQVLNSEYSGAGIYSVTFLSELHLPDYEKSNLVVSIRRLDDFMK